jgi:hypothetical protein
VLQEKARRRQGKLTAPGADAVRLSSSSARVAVSVSTPAERPVEHKHNESHRAHRRRSFDDDDDVGGISSVPSETRKPPARAVVGDAHTSTVSVSPERDDDETHEVCAIVLLRACDAVRVALTDTRAEITTAQVWSR